MNRRFAQELLGFRLHEQVLFDRGRREIGAWLSPSICTINWRMSSTSRPPAAGSTTFRSGSTTARTFSRAADILSENGIFIEAGPARHNNSQGFYLYAYEPGGNRIEIYSGSYLVFTPDWEPVTWNEEERGSGVYWGGVLPRSFLEYATPEAEAPAERLPVFDLH